MRALVALLCVLWPLAAAAETIVADLSQRRVAITTNFTGSEILIFGAVRRDASPQTDIGPLDVIITVSGPPAPVAVRRKDRVAGIWVNTDEVEIDSAPSFYAVLSSGPLNDILSHTEDLRHRVSKERIIRSVDIGDVPDANAFTEALIRIREDQGAYMQDDAGVSLEQETLFRSTVALPANLTEGSYATNIYLLRDKEVVNKFETRIDVRKVGLERFLYNLAHEHALLYGVMSLAIAIAAGWLASAAFTLLRR